MGAVRLRFRAELRSRWRAWLTLALLAGLAGGLVVATAAGARRTDTALARFLVMSRAGDVFVARGYFFGNESLDFKRVARLPQVEAAAPVTSLTVIGRTRSGGSVIPDGSHGVTIQVSLDSRAGTVVDRPKILAGRAPDPRRPNEALAEPNAMKILGLEVGDTLRLRLVTHKELWSGQGSDFFGGNPETTGRGPLVDVRIVGVRASPSPDSGSSVYLGPGFYRRYGGRALASWVDVIGIRLKRGSADVEAFQAGVEGLAGGRDFGFFRATDETGKTQRSIHLQVRALWLAAGLSAAALLLLLGQTLARQATVEAAESATLRALGMTRWQLTGVGIARAAVVGTVAAGATVAVAVALSPLTPLGRARGLEPRPGISLDGLVVAAGAGIMLAGALLAGSLAAWLAARRTAQEASSQRPTRRRATAAEALARAGCPPAMVTGVRMALARGSGASAIPVGSTMLGAAVAVGVVATALTFSASLRHLFETPRLYGQSWDYTASIDQREPSPVTQLLADRAVSAAAAGMDTNVLLDGKQVGVMAMDDFKGTVPPTVVEGRAPQGPGEILLGTKTLHELGVRVGDVVEMRRGKRGVAMRVVGRGVLPAGGETNLGEGAALTFRALKRIVPEVNCCAYHIRIAPGADREAVLARLEHTYLLGPPGRPSDVGNFGGVESMPFVLAGLFGAAAATVLAHTLVTSIRRRRRELAILKTLGFTRGQVLAAVAWQATTVAALALLIGLPIGIASGRWAWNLFAGQLGVVPEPVTPLAPILLVIPAVILLANLIAALPGRLAASTRPAVVLRAE